MIRVRSVGQGSIGAELGILPGTFLYRVNGAVLRDSLDLRFHEAEERVVLEVQLPDGSPVVYEIEKEAGASLGLIPDPDKVRRCTNACSFCFVKGNPRSERLRSPLYVKDDDYRLSFLFGHYITLTNLREEDWQRIAEQRLTPLYVSVHATDGAVRRRMLKNPRSARINEDLDRLGDEGVAIHAQVVLCPEVNDGQVLERTMDDLYARGASVLSLSVVPVGLTRYNQGRDTRLLTREECRTALDQVDRIRQRALEERSVGWCYAADELFLQAGVEVPDSGYYDLHDLVENGVGAVAALRDKIRRDLPRLPGLHGKKIVLVTGTSMGPHLAPLAAEIARASGAVIETVPVDNTLFGPSVTAAGLLSGGDHLRALQEYVHFDVGLFSRVALNEHGRFLDDMSLAELRAALPLRLCPSEHVIDVLSAA